MDPNAHSAALEPRCPATRPDGTSCPTAWCSWCRLEEPEGTEKQPAIEYARGFRLALRDGTAFDCALFPSGRIVTDHRAEGLRTAYLNMEALTSDALSFGMRVEWPEVEQR